MIIMKCTIMAKDEQISFAMYHVKRSKHSKNGDSAMRLEITRKPQIFQAALYFCGYVFLYIHSKRVMVPFMRILQWLTEWIPGKQIPAFGATCIRDLQEVGRYFRIKHTFKALWRHTLTSRTSPKESKLYQKICTYFVLSLTNDNMG